MAYNRKNQLIKILEIQEIFLEYQKKGVTRKWIFDNLISPNYHISMRTFAYYLATNARKELKELKELEGKKKLEENVGQYKLMV